MKFEWSNADDLALALTIGDKIEYRKKGIFSFSATKWAVCLETTHESLNNNLSPVRAKHVRVTQMTKLGEKLETTNLEEFICNGQGRINNTQIAEVKPKQSFSTAIKSMFRRFGGFLSEKLHCLRMFIGSNRGNIFTVGTGVGLVGVVFSIAGLSVTAAVMTGLLAGSTLLLLYLDPYHKYHKRTLRSKRSPSKGPKQFISSRYTRTPARYTLGRKGGYRPL